MALQGLQLSSINIPAHWQPPGYEFNERVVVFASSPSESTGVIIGMEYIESSNQYGTDDEIEIGWHFHVLFDENQPHKIYNPVGIYHQSIVTKQPPIR